MTLIMLFYEVTWYVFIRVISIILLKFEYNLIVLLDYCRDSQLSVWIRVNMTSSTSIKFCRFTLNLLTMRRFPPTAILVYLSLFTNRELLFHSNVDTFFLKSTLLSSFIHLFLFSSLLERHFSWTSHVHLLKLGSLLLLSLEEVCSICSQMTGLQSHRIAVHCVSCEHAQFRYGVNTLTTFVGTLGLYWCVCLAESWISGPQARNGNCTRR